MNHIHRLVWNASKNMLVAVAEIASGRSKASGPRVRGGLPKKSPWVLAIPLLLASASALAFPHGGDVVAGQASIHRNGDTLNIHQGTQKAIINWRSFGIPHGQTVDFHQPGRNSVALNRVTGDNASRIYGRLNANGQVFLVNPNGVLFAKGAEVNVGGIAVSTLNISNRDFLSGNYRFRGKNTAGVTNRGTINAAHGGYVAFIGRNVDNTGHITTPGGATALGAGGSVTLKLAGHHLLRYQVSASALNAQAKNGGVIEAGGGTVILTAKAKNAVLETVVNNTGVVRARTARKHAGVIELLGGNSGTVRVAGTLDASAPRGSHGGTIETSGAHVKVARHAEVTTQAAEGKSGTWTIDPHNFTIAASGGDMTGAALSTALGNGSVTIKTSNGSANGPGDINVNGTVTWNQNTLTLDAYRNININTAINGSGTAGLALLYGQGSASGVINGTSATYIVNAPVNLDSTGRFSTQLGSGGPTHHYTIITQLGRPGSTTGTDLQGINGHLGGDYVLGANIDASTTKNWNSGAGFAPIGPSDSTPFTGIFDGLGHTVSDLTIDRPNTDFVGLFGVSQGAIHNLGVIDVSVSGHNTEGGLVGRSTGTVGSAYATGSVNGNRGVGGLVGANAGTLTAVYATSSVSGSGSNVGGLVGSNGGTIAKAYATGSVSGNNTVGGLVGLSSGKIANTYATGSVSGHTTVGGLVGFSSGKIANTYATGSVSGHAYVGGLVGFNYYGGNATITNGYWDTTTTGAGKNQEIGLGQRAVYGGGGLTSAQMRKASNFKGWSIDTNGSAGKTKPWRIYAGETMPLLTAFLTPLSVTIQDSSQTYNGAVQTSAAGYMATGSYDPGLILGSPTPASGGPNVGTYKLDTRLYSTQQGYDLTITPGTLTITPAHLTLTDLAAASKVYDATTTASATGNLSGIIGSDIVTDRFTASFDNKNVGTGKTVTVTSITLGGADAGNYSIAGGETTIADITPAPLTLAATSATKTYDGTRASPAAVAVRGLKGSDTISGLVERYASQNVLGHDASTLAVASGYTLHDGNGGANYTITTDTARGTITPAHLTLTDLATANKVYDATTTASATGTLSGIIGSDIVTDRFTANFGNKNVGMGKTVTVSGITLGGADAGNYTIHPGQTTTANIIPKILTLTGLNVANKVANGTTAGTISSDGTLLGVLPGDAAHLDDSHAIVRFASMGVGKHEVDVAGLTLSGTDAANYVLATPQITTARILPPRHNGANVASATERTGYATSVSGPPIQLDPRQMYTRVQGPGKSAYVHFTITPGTSSAPNVTCRSASGFGPFRAGSAPLCSANAGRRVP